MSRVPAANAMEKAARLLGAGELGGHDGERGEDHAPCAHADGVPKVVPPRLAALVFRLLRGEAAVVHRVDEARPPGVRHAGERAGLAHAGHGGGRRPPGCCLSGRRMGGRGRTASRCGGHRGGRGGRGPCGGGCRADGWARDVPIDRDGRKYSPFARGRAAMGRVAMGRAVRAWWHGAPRRAATGGRLPVPSVSNGSRKRTACLRPRRRVVPCSGARGPRAPRRVIGCSTSDVVRSRFCPSLNSPFPSPWPCCQ